MVGHRPKYIPGYGHHGLRITRMTPQSPRWGLYIGLPILTVFCICVTLLQHPTAKRTFWDNVNTMVRSSHQEQSRGSSNNSLFMEPASQDVVAEFNKFVVSPQLKQLGLEVMEAFIELATQENITWFMCCGTLLGSYRHHEMVPWDYDYDVLVMRRDRMRLIHAYTRLDSDKFRTTTNKKWTKMYSRQGKRVAHIGNFPMLDIFWLDENATHIWVKTEDLYLSKAATFPLVDRPFHGRMWPGPRDPRKSLEQTYNMASHYDAMDTCQHKRRKLHKIPCGSLANFFPFVVHSRGPGGAYCREDLEINGVSNHTFMRSARNITVC